MMKDPASGIGGASTVAPPLGTRVWLLRDGGFGRIVAVCQGGLLCRILLERGSGLIERPGCELLPLTADDAAA